MNDLDLIVAGAMVTFLAFAGAYVAMRHRANESPVDAYKSGEDQILEPPTAHRKAEPR